MKLIDKPHCRKHEVYTQGCIGCRRKAKQLNTSDEMALRGIQSWPNYPSANNPLSRWDSKQVSSLPPNALKLKHLLEGSDMAVERPEADTDHLESAKKLLKAIYNDGAAGNRRSLTHDLKTLQNLLNAGQQA